MGIGGNAGARFMDIKFIKDWAQFAKETVASDMDDYTAQFLIRKGFAVEIPPAPPKTFPPFETRIEDFKPVLTPEQLDEAKKVQDAEMKGGRAIPDPLSHRQDKMVREGNAARK